MHGFARDADAIGGQYIGKKFWRWKHGDCHGHYVTSNGHAMTPGNSHSFGDATTSVVRGAKPLTARSVVASTLLGVEPPQLAASLLVRSGELFGIAEGTTRVAISRMARNGELIASDGDYRLAGHKLVARQTRQHHSRLGTRRPWDGLWKMVLVIADDRDANDRLALRSAARQLRFGERREGFWLRPDNLPTDHDIDQPDATGTINAQCERFSGQPTGEPELLARRLWDLDDWATRAGGLAAAIDELSPVLASGTLLALPPAFVVSAATLRHFQADPLLPDELLPSDWPGTALRKRYEQFDAAFKSTWTDWFATQR